MSFAPRTAAWLAVIVTLAVAAFATLFVSLRDPGTAGSPTVASDDDPMDPSEVAPANGSGGSHDSDASLEHLRGLGYLAWDEGADPREQGVTRHEPKNVAPGYNLFGDGDLQFHLMDMEGEIVHTWTVPETSGACVHGEMLQDGRLLAICFGRTLFLVDWNSDLQWELSLRAHHDPALLPDGSFLVPYNELVSHAGRRTLFDGIAQVSPKGEFRKRWFSYNHLDRLKGIHGTQTLDIPPTRPDAERPELGFDYYHLNSVEILPRTELGGKDSRFRAGNILVCFRNTSLIAVLDQDDMSIVWHWGPGEIELPHSPTMLPDGRILLFDNGYHRGYSRVIEIDPSSGKILWSYEGEPRNSFFSKEQGSAQRLANGNTLICESDRGRVFEVTRQGEMVWEYWSPVVAGSKRKRIYKMIRLAPELVAGLLEDHP
jgi:hypothetical protein